MLENVCSLARISLDILLFPDRDQQLTFARYETGSSCRLLDTPETLGYLYLAINPIGVRDDLLLRIHRFKKRAAILDEIGNIQLPGRMRESRWVKTFRMTTLGQPAREIGRLLLSLGHRNIAYFSPFHALQWSVARSEGLAGVFGALKGNAALVPFTLDRATHILDYVSDSRERKRSALKAFYSTWKSSVEPEIQWRLDPIVQRALLTEWGWGEVYRCLSPLFARALARRAITAWVCVNDTVALMALDFLHKRAVRVPRDISVIGFDDSPEALDHRLTSYNFNIPAVVNAMLSHILGRPLPGAARRQRVVEITGAIVERATTGRAVEASGNGWPCST